MPSFVTHVLPVKWIQTLIFTSDSNIGVLHLSNFIITVRPFLSIKSSSRHKTLLTSHKCAFANNILLISFIFKLKFIFCICIIAVDLIFVDFRFYSFCLEICYY
jgi:hypothetical protein